MKTNALLLVIIAVLLLVIERQSRETNRTLCTAVEKEVRTACTGNVRSDGHVWMLCGPAAEDSYFSNDPFNLKGDKR